MNRTRAGPSVLRTAVIVTAPLTWTNRYESLSTRFVRIAVRIPRVCIDSCYNNKISNWHNIECLVLLLWKLASFFYCKQFSLGKETSNKYLKCPYHQNFYFPIWSYISHNELLRKKFSIWIKSDFLNKFLKTCNLIFLRLIRAADHKMDMLRVVTLIQERVTSGLTYLAWFTSVNLVS